MQCRLIVVLDEASARSFAGSIRYSIVTSTGPSPGDGSSAKSETHGDGDGRRSTGRASGSRTNLPTARPPMRVAAAASSASGTPILPASHPQHTLPDAMPPKMQSRLSERARARTHAGTEFWAATLTVDAAEIHAAPAGSSSNPTASGLSTCAIAKQLSAEAMLAAIRIESGAT